MPDIIDFVSPTTAFGIPTQLHLAQFASLLGPCANYADSCVDEKLLILLGVKQNCDVIDVISRLKSLQSNFVLYES